MKEVLEYIPKDQVQTFHKYSGFHIHVDVKDFNEQEILRLINNWLNVENYMDRYIPDDRKNYNNRFVLPMRLYIPESDILIKYMLRYNLYKTKYSKFNINYLSTPNKHIEFRSPGSTVEYEEVKQWVLFAQRFVEVSKTTDIYPENIWKVL